MLKKIVSESRQTELSDVHRWEDEGGQMNEHSEWMPSQPLAQSVPGTAGKHDRSLQWSEHFVIEPVQPGHGIFLIRKKPATKSG